MQLLRSVLTVVLLATTLVVAGESVPAGAVTPPTCTSEPGLSASTIRLSGVPDDTLVEVFVDGALIEAFGLIGGRADVGIPAEDTEPHSITVRLDADPQRIIDCGPVAALPAFPSDIASCSIEGVVDGAPHIAYSTAEWLPLLVRNGQVITTRSEPEVYVDLSALPSTRYHYALRFVGAQPTLEIPCGTVTTPARTTAQRLATSRYFESIHLAPYAYVTMRPTCPGCDEPFLVYSTVSGAAINQPPEGCAVTDLACSPGDVFDPPLEEQGTLPAGHPGLHPPRALGRALDVAIGAGKHVELTTDGFGLISSWSIDSYGAEITCVAYDTRPPEFGEVSCDLFGQTNLVRDAPDLVAILGARDSPGVARGILRLYDAYFGRTPDVAGARYWVDLAAQGLAPTAIADLFVASRESELSWDAESTSAFIDRIYDNVFGRSPDAVGAAYWTALIDDGLSRGQVIWWFAQSTEFRRQHPYSPSLLSDDGRSFLGG